MIANDIYLVDLPSDETFLSSEDNLLIITAIFQQAIEKHLSIYHDDKVPLSFIEFYINEIKNYEYLFRKQIKDFFETFNKVAPNLEIVANIYNKSYFAQSTEVFHSEDEIYLRLANSSIIDYISDIINNSKKDVVSAVTNILQITNHINSSDEIIPFYEIYENYMISNLIKKSEFNKYSGKSKFILNIQDNSESPQIKAAVKKAERLTSERINLSKQKGKVTKIVIPRLKLPSSYPKTTTFNRFNSKYKANNFISASRQILILNDLKINGVAYSNNFIEKRKAINNR